MRVYLDYAATTPLDPQVINKMMEVMSSHFGNPSSVHQHGRKARAMLEGARKTVANAINASMGEIFFTSCATEANNMILKCAVRDLGIQRIISSSIEHHCVLHVTEELEKSKNIEVVHLDLDEKGFPDLNQLEQLLQCDTPTLVSLMHVNNELGTKLDIDKVADICAKNNALFHSDTAQSMGKFPIDVSNTKINFLSASAHKFYGPKGAGFAYINNDNQIKPMFHGGAQERNMRAGTENLHGIIGLAEALSMAQNTLEERVAHCDNLRSYLIKNIKSITEDIIINSPEEKGYSPFILNLSFPPSPKNNLLLLNLDISGVSVSGGSACSSGIEYDSHVMKALQTDPTRKSVRFSFSHNTTIEELDFALEKLTELLAQSKTGST